MTDSKQIVERILCSTMDPTVTINGKSVPALTTMIYRVCDNDEDKFAEATRLVELFIVSALGIDRLEEFERGSDDQNYNRQLRQGDEVD